MWIDINKNNILRKEEKEMENKKLVVKGTEMEVVDGKVVISSEELAAAIQTQQIDLGAEEEANIDINIRGVHQCGQPSVNLRKSIHKSEKHVRKILGGTRLGP